MNNSALIQLLSKPNKAELKELESFLNSPYFNKNKNVTALFRFLISPGLKNLPEITNRDIHSFIFKGKKFNNENVKTIIHLLTRLTEKFLVINESEKDDREFNRKLLKILNQRGLDKHFRKHLQKTGKPELARGEVELDKISRKAEYEKTLLQFYLPRNDENNIFTHEMKLSEDLIAAFFVDMFKQFNIFWRAVYLNNMVDVEFTSIILDSIDLEGLFRSFSKHNYRYDMLLKPHYEIYKLLKDDSGEIEIENLICNITGNHFISGNEKFVLSTILVNTIYYKRLKSGSPFTKELFEALKLMMEFYKYSGEQFLRYTMYSNILRIGLQLGEYEWTEEFIKNYHILLEDSIKDNMLIYSNAYLAFTRGDFEKCLEYESKINFQTFQQRYYLRDLRLSSLYELGKFETALSLIDSYKHFIKKDQNYTPKMKQGYLLFLSFINDLIRLKLGISRKNAGDIMVKLTNSMPMRKDWLMKKFDEITQNSI